MDSKYKELDKLSTELYKSLVNITIKLKDNTQKGEKVTNDLTTLNENLKHFYDLHKKIKDINKSCKVCTKDTNKELIKVKEEELNFLEKLRKFIMKNKDYLSKSDLPLSILHRLKEKKGFSTFKDDYDKRDQYNRDVYKYLSKSLDDLPKSKDTKQLQTYKKELSKLLDKVDSSNKRADKLAKS